MRKLAVLLCLCLLFAGCTAQKIDRSGFALDTVVNITLYDGKTADLDACYEELERLENLLSATVEGSDIHRINTADGAAITVSPETADLLRLAQTISALSDGAFDMTIRPLSALWDFSGDTPALPDEAALAAACQLVDYRQLTVTDTTVTLPQGGLEPGGVAKGYIADRLCALLAERGVTSALIDLGGNIVAHGRKNGELWRVGIKDPAAPASLSAIVAVSDLSVVTSGTYERGFTLNGVRYHHLLDPKTGMPVQNDLASVTILDTGSARADALSTACFVLGEQRARELLSTLPDTEALFIRTDGTLSVTDGLVCTDPSADIPTYTVVS